MCWPSTSASVGMMILPAYLGRFFGVADVDAHGGNEAADLLVPQQLFVGRLFDVQHLAAQGKHRLVMAIAARFGRAACRLTFHQEQFRFVAIARRAVHQFSGQAPGIEDILAIFEVLFCLGRGFAGLGRQDHFFHDLGRFLGVFLQVFAELFLNYAADDPFHFRIVQLDLGLRFELRLGNLHADDAREAFAKILADGGQVFLEEILLRAITIERTRQGRAESRHVRAAARVVGVVCVATDPFLLARGVLQGCFHAHVVDGLFDVDGFVQRALVAVEVFDEFRHAAGIEECIFLAGSFVDELDVTPCSKASSRSRDSSVS